MATPSKHEELSASRLLLRAASTGDLAAVNDQLGSGADVNFANEAGQTVLMLATIMGHAHVATRLIQAGANPNLKDRLGLTALEWSKRRGFSEITEALTKLTPPATQLAPATSPPADQIDNETTTPELVVPVVSSPADEIDNETTTPEEVAPALSSPANEIDNEATTSEPVPAVLSSPADEIDNVTTTPELVAPVLSSPANEIDNEATSPELVAPVLSSPADEIDNVTTPEPIAPVLSSPANEIDNEETTSEPVVPTLTAPLSVTTSEPDLKTESSATKEDASAPMQSVIEPSSKTEPPVVSAPTQRSRESSDDYAWYSSASATNESYAERLPTEADAKSSTSKPKEVKQPIASEPPAAPAPPQAESTLPITVAPSFADDSQDEEETVTRPRTSGSADASPIKPAAPPTSSLVETVPQPRLPESSVRERPSVFSGSPLGLSGIGQPDRGAREAAEVSNLKRCPKCNTIYHNTPLVYCTRDSAPLTGIQSLHSSAPPETSSAPIAIWLLIAFVLGASAFAAYRVTQYFTRPEAPAPVATKPAEPPSVVEVKKPLFTVGGDLAGMETNVPEPEYPADLQGTGIAEPITVRVRVNRNGRVISAATTSGDRRLRAAAVKAAKQASFAPDKLAEANPQNRVTSGTITYEFQSPQAAPASSPTGAPTPATSATAVPDAPVVSESLAGAVVNVPEADYPASVRRAGIQETITVTIRVNRAGRVISWRTSSGNAQLRAAAIKAARKASFSRGKLPGTGDVLGTITYNFTP